jgi:hypothetical protein
MSEESFDYFRLRSIQKSLVGINSFDLARQYIADQYQVFFGIVHKGFHSTPADNG